MLTFLVGLQEDVVKGLIKVLVGLFCLLPAVASAQVMTTANPSGSGKNTVTVSLPYQADDNYGLHSPQVSLVRGLANWLDIHVGVGANRYGGNWQAWVSGGGNLRVLKLGKNSVSLFGVVEAPLHRREESSKSMVNSAVIISRELTPQLTVYAAANWLKPLDGQEGTGYMPTQKRFDVPIGASVDWGDSRLIAELDFGSMKALSMSVRKTF